MSRHSGIWLLGLIALVAVFGTQCATAQDHPDEMPLGDVARNLRKNTPPSKPVIDDDNLPQVMQEADAHRGLGLRFLMSGNRSGFQVEAPDVTCSLSFSANVKSLLAGQYAEMELPPGDMAKIEGKAVVEGDALTVPVFNRTRWHLSEITVAFTVLRKGRSETGRIGRELENSSGVVPLPQEPQFDPFQQVRPEKKPDLTVMYRMRAAGLPWSNAVFSAPLQMELAAGEEWHWAIVQARGYPPETNVSSVRPLVTEPARQEFIPSGVSMKSAEVQNQDSTSDQPHQ